LAGHVKKSRRRGGSSGEVADGETSESASLSGAVFNLIRETGWSNEYIGWGIGWSSLVVYFCRWSESVEKVKGEAGQGSQEVRDGSQQSHAAWLKSVARDAGKAGKVSPDFVLAENFKIMKVKK
jgi:hypothetical protein